MAYEIKGGALGVVTIDAVRAAAGRRPGLAGSRRQGGRPAGLLAPVAGPDQRQPRRTGVPVRCGLRLVAVHLGTVDAARAVQGVRSGEVGVGGVRLRDEWGSSGPSWSPLHETASRVRRRRACTPAGLGRLLSHRRSSHSMSRWSWTATVVGPSSAACHAPPATRRERRRCSTWSRARRDRRPTCFGVHVLHRELAALTRWSPWASTATSSGGGATRCTRWAFGSAGPAGARAGDRSSTSSRRPNAATADDTVLTLTMCVNYGGQAEIADAAARIAADARAGRLVPDKVDEKVFARYLDEPELPDVDLFLRSSRRRDPRTSCSGSPRMRSWSSSTCCGRMSTGARCGARSRCMPPATAGTAARCRTSRRRPRVHDVGG